MRPKFQFAFLGPHNSYLASVTSGPVQSGRSIESVKIYHRGLPQHWVDRYLELTRNRYISNIRGNDVFGFLGHSTNGTTKTYTEKSENMIVEIEALKCFVGKDKTKTSEPVLLSLGPAPGSFFAELSSLKRYRWANLPPDLEDAIQEELCRNGYGTIHDVAINAAGGWVMQFHEGKSYNWGGDLPGKLKNLLSIGAERELQLKNLHLNHQNKDDYVLVFMNGTSHIRLHEDFEQDMKTLIDSTFASNLPSLFSKPTKSVFNFTASCTCSSQHQINAAYYNKRGRFHLYRSSPVHALAYMREAYRLDTSNKNYKADYFMARVATRKLEQSAEECLQEDGAFQNESEFQRNRTKRVEQLRTRLDDMLREAQQQNLPKEWSFTYAAPVQQQASVVEYSIELDGEGEPGPFELESTGQVSSPREAAKRILPIYR